MSEPTDGTAVVYCEGAFGTTNGKTAHGLVRRTARYRVACVVDSAATGRDAGEVLDGAKTGIPVVASLDAAAELADTNGTPLTHFVVGLAPDGGRLDGSHRAAVETALRRGLHVDAGLHDFLSEDDALVRLAAESGVRIRDIRKPKHRRELHFFSGRIEEVASFRVAVLGTDSAIGKRTTAWLLVDALGARGHTTELIGTGQTAWLQGARYSLILDSIVNDFVSGEIEHAMLSAWDERRPDALVLEGQGSLMNPAYPGGFELLAAGDRTSSSCSTRRRVSSTTAFPDIRSTPFRIRSAPSSSSRDVPSWPSRSTTKGWLPPRCPPHVRAFGTKRDFPPSTCSSTVRRGWPPRSNRT